MAIDNYTAKAADWRASLRKNTRRTYFVIASFILIYVAIGLLVDLFITSGHYLQASLSQLFYALVTFQLFPLATVITTGVAVIALWVTFTWHDKLMLLGTEYHEITPETAKDLTEKQFYNVVEEVKVAAGLKFMPKVYIIEADYMNAFASGYSEKSSMVAITRGLLNKLDRAEVQAVMAHEISHVRHMDIKLTLMAAVLSNITLIVVDILFYSAIFSGRSEDSRGRNQLFIIIMIIRYLMPLITILLIMYLSRTREYMADAGCVELLRDNEPLARALLKIQDDHENNKESYGQAYNATPHESVRRQAYIYDPVQAGIEPVASLSDLFSTHPNLKDRLAALGYTKGFTSGNK
jgi:heat shock protein HtpX